MPSDGCPEPVPAFNVFAFVRDDEDGLYDERRDRVSMWRIEDVVRWAVSRGYDSVLIERVGETRFHRRKAPPT